MTPDYRAMCAELADALVEWQLGGGPPEDTADADLIDRARALLAKADGPAVPDGREPASVALQPSDGEIMGLMPQQMHDDLAAAVRAMAEQEGIDSTPAKGVLRIILNRHVVDLARAVLARWGRLAAAPVPLSERLPGPEDCDEQGRCWLPWHQMGNGTPTWILGYPAWAKRFPDVHRFWLPAHALPLPPRGRQ